MEVINLKKLKELFNAAAMDKQPEPELDCVEYNWKKPHYFDSENIEPLTEFANLLTRNISNTFSALCYCQMKSEVKKLDQHFGSILINETLDDQNDLLMPFNSDKKLAGFLRIPLKTAMAWVVHLLQDDEIEPNEKNYLSVLEENLLIDIAQNIVTALSNSLIARDGDPVISESQLIKDKKILPLDQLQQLFEIEFSISNSENVISDASIFIFSEKLNTIAGKPSDEKNEITPERINAAREANLARLYLPVTAELGQVSISLSDLASLAPGDVIKMDKKLDTSVLVKIKNKPSFRAWPVQSNSKYALLIDDLREL